MKFKIFKIFLLCLFFIFPMLAADNNATNIITISQELREKHTIKPHHQKLKFDCTDCHVNQGDDPSKFKSIGDKGCLSCHKSKEYMASRTGYMDMLKANPHNSVHDGPNLYCDECHMEHKKSTNMCSECHENEVKKWMRPTP